MCNFMDLFPYAAKQDPNRLLNLYHHCKHPYFAQVYRSNRPIRGAHSARIPRPRPRPRSSRTFHLRWTNSRRCRYESAVNLTSLPWHSGHTLEISAFACRWHAGVWVISNLWFVNLATSIVCGHIQGHSGCCCAFLGHLYAPLLALTSAYRYHIVARNNINCRHLGKQTTESASGSGVTCCGSAMETLDSVVWVEGLKENV